MQMLSAASPDEKLNAFNSVIRTLEPKGESSVLARALVLRSELYVESGRYQEALTDARQVLTMPTTIQVSRRAWRLQTDAHTSLGQIDDALCCLQDWLKHDPAFRSKIATEIERIRRLKNA
jgi:tetratricopeptide (TPR) repeat protein